MKNARAYLFSMAFPRVGVAARPLLATGWPIVATRAHVRRSGTRTPVSRTDAIDVTAGSRPPYGRTVTRVQSSNTPRASSEPHRWGRPLWGRIRHARAHSDLTVHGRQGHGRQGERTPRSRRQGYSGRPPRVRTECGVGRPQRIRQDDIGGSPRADRGGSESGGPGGGRHRRLRLRRDRAPAAALGAALPGTRRLGRIQDQYPRHPRIRRLRRGTQGRSAGSGRGPFRRLGLGRGGRLDPDGVGGVRGGRHAARHRDHPPRIGARRLRRDDPELRRGIRRGRPRRRTAAVSAAARRGGARRARARDRPDRSAVATVVRLLLRGAQGGRARARTAAADRGGAQPADRGDHRRERGRDPHGPLSRRRADRLQDTRAGPGTGRGARGLLPRAGGRARRRGPARASVRSSSSNSSRAASPPRWNARRPR